MKNLRVLMSVLWSCLVLLPVTGRADSFAASQVGGSLTSTIIMTVGTPTCTLDNTVQTVDFQDVTVSALRSHTAGMPAGAVLNCDSIPAGITLTLTPAGSSTVDNVASPGVVTGSLTGTGYRLTWASGSAFGTQDAAVEYNTPLTVPAALTSDLKMTVTPVATSSGNIASGPSQAVINMVLNFS